MSNLAEVKKSLEAILKHSQLLLDSINTYEEEERLSPEEGHNFEWAMAQMRQGKKVRRLVWSTRCVYMNAIQNAFLQNNDSIASSWIPGQLAIFATDWEIKT